MLHEEEQGSWSMVVVQVQAHVTAHGRDPLLSDLGLARDGNGVAGYPG